MKSFIKVYLFLLVVAFTMGLQNSNSYAQEIIPLYSIDDLKETIPIQEEEIIPEVIETYASELKTSDDPNPKEYRYIKDCPLSEEIQEDIFDICESYNISFEFVMAVIAQESGFRPEALGDNCESKGLMQIQPKWHSELMKDLGVTDLFTPTENVKVGAALLSSYFEESDDVYYVLMKYNGGGAYAHKMMKAGKVSDYAREITERAIMYEEANGI